MLTPLKKLLCLLTVCALLLGSVLLVGCDEWLEEDEPDIESANKPQDDDNDDDKASKPDDADKSSLENFSVVIQSCRLATDYEGKPIAIIQYSFTNNSDDSDCFAYAIEDKVYQDGVSLNHCYVAADSANYNDANQTKEIKKGVTLEVEVAYVLNDTTTNLDVEITNSSAGMIR